MTVGRLELEKGYELKIKQIKEIVKCKTLPETIQFLVDFFLSTKDDFFKSLNEENIDPVFKDFAKKYPALVSKLPHFFKSQGDEKRG